MPASTVQLTCGALAIAIPTLLAAGYYAQVLLDRLGDGRDLFVIAVTTVGGLIGEVAALVGLLRPGRAWAAIAALGTALSATGVILVPLFAVRVRGRQRAAHSATAQPAVAPAQRHPMPARPLVPSPHPTPKHQTPQRPQPTQTRSALP